MKKLSLLIAASAMATCAFAATQTWVEFSSEGPDRYADGTIVQDGEVYALVWIKSGATFQGIKADGTVVDPETSKVVWLLPRAKDGRCKKIICTLKDENAELAEKGSFAVYLLDTRTRASADAANVTSGSLETTTVDSVPVVNSYDDVTGKVTAGSTVKVAANSVTGAGAVASEVPADVPQPKISAIEVVGGKVVVTVSNTVPYIQYGITSGDTLDNMSKNALVNGVNGSSEKSGEITLVVDDPKENRFFKVTRK